MFYLGSQRLSLEDIKQHVFTLETHAISRNGYCQDMRGGVDRVEIYASYSNAVFDLVDSRKKLHENDFDLLDLIEAYKFRETSDLRDRLFAFTSVACNVPDDFVNYRLPLRDCLIHCAKKLMLGVNGLEKLRCVYAGAHTDASKERAFSFQQQSLRLPNMPRQDLPSWCPDWSEQFLVIH